MGESEEDQKDGERISKDGLATIRASIVERDATDNQRDIVQWCEYDVDPSVRFGNESDQVFGADKGGEDDQSERHAAVEFDVVASEGAESNNGHPSVEESNLTLPSGC
jgi:hypothetical protein